VPISRDLKGSAFAHGGRTNRKISRYFKRWSSLAVKLSHVGRALVTLVTRAVISRAFRSKAGPYGRLFMEAERRQVTVLFTDMVGFTTFSEKFGEEAAFTLMRSLAKPMEESVREQGGVVQGFTGDGIMAVFGAPVAFEDAPLRACRAALSILQKVKADGGHLAAKHGVQPQLRIGLNSGAAVVGAVQGGVDAGVHGSGRHRKFCVAPASAGRAGFSGDERGHTSAGTRHGRRELRR
jgi:class 3 adenylate cyclase